MRTATALGLAGLLFLAACSKPTDTIIPSDMATWDKELAPAAQKLSEEDRKIFAAYVARMKIASVFSGGKTDIPFGTTIGQALEQQRTWQADFEKSQAEEAAKKAKEEAEQRALKERMEAERASLIAAINDAVTVTLVSKGELLRDFDARRIHDQQRFVIAAQSKASTTIVGVSGEIEFVDLFDKVVGSVSFRMSERIPPGETAKWIGVRDYNQFIQEHKAVWNLEEGQYTTRFIPAAVVFEDGTKLTMPE